MINFSNLSPPNKGTYRETASLKTIKFSAIMHTDVGAIAEEEKNYSSVQELYSVIQLADKADNRGMRTWGWEFVHVCATTDLRMVWHCWHFYRWWTPTEGFTRSSLVSW